jgi:4-alpha-glucanotransferase
MNFPSTTSGNWKWRMKKGTVTDDLINRIKSFVQTFGRY